MINRIFDDRLQCDFITVIRKACLINIKLIPELIFIAEILNMQIALCMLQLFLNRDQLMSAADADAEQPCQGIDHLHGIFIASGFAHPGDRIQCIIEEMWIDLCLKCLQFCFSKADLFLADFFHQLLDPYCHMFKRIRQGGNLFGSRHRMIDKLGTVSLEFSHRTHQACNRF